MRAPQPDRDALVRLEAVVRGRVQGVGFRYFVLAEARRRQLSGWVRNEPGGSVRCVAEGPRADLEELLDRLHEGPAGAWVDSVSATWGQASGPSGRFEIRSGSHAGD